MNVLFLSTWFPFPPDNGSKIRAHYLLRALMEAHDVTVVAFRPDDAQSAHCRDMPCQERVRVHPVQVDPFRHVAASTLVRYASPLPLAFWPSRRMRETVSGLSANRRWDAVVAVQSPVAQYAPQAGDGPRVIDVDTALSYQMHERHVKQAGSAAERMRNWVSWQKAHQYEARMFRRFHACTLSASIELAYVSAMVSHAQTAVKVVPNGVDCERNHPGLARTGEASLVFNGAMTYSANFDAMHYFLAEVYPHIQQQVEGTSLTITGSTSDVRLTDLQLDDSIRLSGYVADIRPVIASAAVCVVPLRQGGGTRLKILEAMALGTPVVSTTKGAEGLEVTSGHDILIADKPAEFADRVIHLVRDAALRDRLARNARHLVETRYDWQKIGQGFVDLVEETVERRRLADSLL